MFTTKNGCSNHLYFPMTCGWHECELDTVFYNVKRRNTTDTTLQIDGQHSVSVCWLRVTGIRRVLFIDLAALKMAAPPPPRHSLQACHLTQLPLALVPSRPPLYSLSCWDDPVGGTPNPIPIPQNMNKRASVQSWTVIYNLFRCVLYIIRVVNQFYLGFKKLFCWF